jgi:hypothetical protein
VIQAYIIVLVGPARKPTPKDIVTATETTRTETQIVRIVRMVGPLESPRITQVSSYFAGICRIGARITTTLNVLAVRGLRHTDRYFVESSRVPPRQISPTLTVVAQPRAEAAGRRIISIPLAGSPENGDVSVARAVDAHRRGSVAIRRIRTVSSTLLAAIELENHSAVFCCGIA